MDSCITVKPVQDLIRNDFLEKVESRSHPIAVSKTGTVVFAYNGTSRGFQKTAVIDELTL